MKRKSLSLLLAFGLVLSLLAGTALAAPTPTFTDVVEGDWYERDVAYVYEHGLMDGTGSDDFSPSGTTTRAALVTILYRMEGEPAASGTGGFADVAGTAWYAPAVAWAAGNHIVTGTTDTTFSPNQPITREQLAVILYRYAQAKGWDTVASADLSGYRDQGSISAYARDAMAWANGTGLIGGTTSTTLSPQSTATRAQAAAILHRFCQEISPVPPPANGETFVPAPDAAAVLDQMPQTFLFTSGAGGWGTTLTIQKDGSFAGPYHDSEMGDTGPGYPHGTVYYCNFTGRFVNVTQVSDLEYRMTLSGLSMDAAPGTVTIRDSIRYIATEPYGLDNASQFCLYLPGRATSDLPSPFLQWVGPVNGWGNHTPAVLPFWGLYNVGGQQGFYGTD